MGEQLIEYVTCEGQTLGVDRDNGLIRGVKLLGKNSRNGRRYTEAAIAGAAKLYEGAKVNINHRKPGSTDPRGYQERIGNITNPTIREGELYGDFQFNPKHQLAEQLCWDAEKSPRNVGFSHDATGKTSRQGGVLIVEAITHVNSVDLVADPATTNGLFEAEQTQETAMSLKDLTLEQLKAERSDLFEAVLTEHANGEAAKAKDAKLAKLEEQVKTLESEKAAAILETTIAKEIEAARLPAAVITEGLKKSLKALDADARKELIGNLQEAAKAIPAGTKPQSKEQRVTEGEDAQYVGAKGW